MRRAETNASTVCCFVRRDPLDQTNRPGCFRRSVDRFDNTCDLVLSAISPFSPQVHPNLKLRRQAEPTRRHSSFLNFQKRPTLCPGILCSLPTHRPCPSKRRDTRHFVKRRTSGRHSSSLQSGAAENRIFMASTHCVNRFWYDLVRFDWIC